MIEGLLEAETKVDVEHWLQVATEDAIRDARRRKSKLVVRCVGAHRCFSPYKISNTEFCCLQGGFTSPSQVSLRAFPPADVSPSQRTPPLSSKSRSRQSSPTIIQSSEEEPSGPESPLSQKLLRRRPDSPEERVAEARLDIQQISKELDSVKELIESNFLRATRAQTKLDAQLKMIDEAEERARIAASLAPGSFEEEQRQLLEKVAAETDRLEQSVKKLQEEDEKSQEKDEVILEVRINDLTKKLNKISVRQYSSLRSWRQMLLLLVFMALWPMVLRYFWTLYGRTVLKRVFRALDWLYRLRDSTEPAIHVLVQRGRRVARSDLLRMPR